MNLPDLSALTAALVTIGPLVLAFVVLLGTLGLPMPSSVLLVAVGAFARQGLLDLPTALAFGLVAAIAGDGIGYALGRWAGDVATRRFGGSSAWTLATTQLAQRGALAVFLSRWLITPLAVPVNILAGVGRIGFGRFLLAEVAGDLVWIALYAGVGYAVGSQWEVASTLLSNYGTTAALVATALGAGYLALRMAAQKGYLNAFQLRASA